MWPDVKEEVELELAQLQKMFEKFSPLRSKVQVLEPDQVELAALATFLHSFYNGVENIFKRIAVHLDGGPPGGEAWHSLLLHTVTEPRQNRPPAISEPLSERLRQYMDFRHFFRHAYAFDLKWSRMASLIFAAEETLRRLESELEVFLAVIAPKDTDR